MRCSIIPPVSFGLLLALGGGCSPRPALFEAEAEAKSATPPVPSRTTVPAGANSDAAVPERLIRITAFDCEKLEELPGVARATGPVASTTGIRAWHGGGPNGSNWNVADLRCVTEVTTDCRRGKLTTVLHVGRTVVGKRQLDVTKAGPVSLELVVPEIGWRRNLEDRAAQLPYRTAVFRATVTIGCKDPQADLPQSRYPEVSDDNVFVAGFSSGE